MAPLGQINHETVADPERAEGFGVYLARLISINLWQVQVLQDL